MKLRFEALANSHDRSAFLSGHATLDAWFRTQAKQQARRHVAQVFVAVDEVGIAGFYTLSMFSVKLDALPDDFSRRLPRYPDVPAALIGRLARAQRLTGQGMGEQLVADALTRVLQAARMIATAVIVVDAKDAAASRFYERLGFLRFPKRVDRLFMPTQTAVEVDRRTRPRD